MKTYKHFTEAVSAARLAQLAAKGKGAAAEAKMKADGLSGNVQRNQKALPPANVTGGLALTDKAAEERRKQRQNSGPAKNKDQSKYRSRPAVEDEKQQTGTGGKQQEKKKKTLRDRMGQAGSALKKGQKKFQKAQNISRQIFNRPGSVGARGDSDASTGRSTQIDRG